MAIATVVADVKELSTDSKSRAQSPTQSVIENEQLKFLNKAKQPT